MKKHYLILIAIAAFFSTLTTQAQVPYNGIPYEFVPATLDELANRPWARMAHGTFINPGQTLGAGSSGSTHKIITVFQNDNNTCDNNGLGIVLSTLPSATLIPDWDIEKDGQLRAMRLGDDVANNPLGSQMTYYFKPDSARNVIMVYFAFVAQSPSHPSYTQNPSFMIELLRANNQRISTTDPKHAYFWVNPSENPESHDALLMQHNKYYACGQIPYDYRQWSNWVPVAFDLRGYIGTEIRLRISVTDCSPAGHYAYAYFAIRGASGSVDVKAGEKDDLYFSVPSGFYEYQWEVNGRQIFNPTHELKRDRTANDTTIVCTATSINGATMTFTAPITTTDYYYELKPDFAFALDSTSNYNVQFTNQSILNIINGGDTIPQTVNYVAWDFGDGTPVSTEINPMHQYANPGSYTVSLTLYDNDRICNSTIYKEIKIDSSSCISGVISPVVPGVVLLYAAPNGYDTPDSMRVSNGSYRFDNVPNGNYIVKFIPDAKEDYLPTYYGNVEYWDNSKRVAITCNCIDTVDIALLPAPPPLNGDSYITGELKEAYDDAMGKPKGIRLTPDEDVSLQKRQEDNSWETIAVTTTDANGWFEFRNVPDGRYRFLVDVLGMELTNTCDIVVGVRDTVEVELLLEPAKVGVTELRIANYKLRVYPNPTSGELRIERVEFGEWRVESGELRDLEGSFPI